MAKLKTWHRLDNSGKIYPFNLKNNFQNLFRITALLKEDVKPDILRSSVQVAIKRYPYFNVCLRRGIFWHYLEELDGKPEVYLDSDLLLKDIDTVETYGYNFRVSYYKNKVSIDCFHALCDGNGLVEFFKTILYEYFVLSGVEIADEGLVRLPDSPIDPEEVEDGFLKNAQKVSLFHMKGLDGLKGEKAYTFPDKRFDYQGSGVITGTVNSKQLLDRAHELGVTVTAYVGGALIYSIFKSKIDKSASNLPIVLFVPINLRKPFNCNTMLNFSLFSRVAVDINDNPSFETIVYRVRDYLKKDTGKEVLQNKLNVTAKTERLPIFRILPLPIKQFIYKVAGPIFGKAKKTMTFSNMGVVKLPSGMNDFIEEMSIEASTAKTSPEAMTSVTVLDKTTFTFARKIISKDVEKYFFTFLVSQGIDVTVKSNYWED